MGKITIELIIRIVEVIYKIAVVISDSLNGRKQNDSAGNSKEK